MNQFLAFALALRNRASRTLDVGARPSVTAVDEQCARPNIDRQLVLAGEIVIEPAQQQLFETCFSILLRFESG